MEKFIINSLSELNNFADTLLQHLNKKQVIAFYGPMGAGKTTLIKQLCEKLNVVETVTSPTFSLINEYSTKEGEIIYHFDFYRINRIEELFDMGYEEYFFSGNKCFIEWPEKIEDYLPSGTLSVVLQITSNTQRIIEIN